MRTAHEQIRGTLINQSRGHLLHAQRDSDELIKAQNDTPQRSSTGI
ncbi:MAG TPA: hypothetical protein PLV50_08740 [Smithella sp.]|nr:hypothetical protein [Smithella sp.]MDM7987764.1 hypothetical protein [Smithella sp.]HNY49629.1 hypothetical protein [Smithella sp.]HOG90612.1 hypothetical protein [Smithella sp.]HOU51419.1 hypothetical protein [Smithella sp.]